MGNVSAWCNLLMWTAKTSASVRRKAISVHRSTDSRTETSRTPVAIHVAEAHARFSLIRQFDQPLIAVLTSSAAAAIAPRRDIVGIRPLPSAGHASAQPRQCPVDGP